MQSIRITKRPPSTLRKWNKYPKASTTEPSDWFLKLRETSLKTRWEVENPGLFNFFSCYMVNGCNSKIPELFKSSKHWKKDVILP